MSIPPPEGYAEFRRNVIEPMAERALLSGQLDEAERDAELRLANDTEWNTPTYFHVSTLIQAIMVGIQDADDYVRNYSLPPDFESVVNWVAWNLQHEAFPGDHVPCVTLRQMRALYLDWLRQHPVARDWEKDPPGTPLVIVVTMYDAVAERREAGINLETVARNAALYLRMRARDDAVRSADFERRWNGWRSRLHRWWIGVAPGVARWLANAGAGRPISRD